MAIDDVGSGSWNLTAGVAEAPRGNATWSVGKHLQKPARNLRDLNATVRNIIRVFRTVWDFVNMEAMIVVILGDVCSAAMLRQKRSCASSAKTSEKSATTYEIAIKFLLILFHACIHWRMRCWVTSQKTHALPCSKDEVCTN